MEPEDTSARAHRRETVRVSPVRGHVQAEGASAEAFVLGASQCHQYAGGGRPLQLLLLLDVVRDVAGAGAASVRAPQQSVAEQELARLRGKRQRDGT